ncbi:proline-, glutamic acid- and leucine-rich protein 1 [Toxorhynchites rutilus septentrionalis]|uniref:proline-, glutamic acid- and leucine-rich protein 1 n=1 Tax=Toxorhynchites rutilus septentrionalis TaxID=329112 RepID=UPI00247934F5|nr:proline-, glutamic acid- and leucine-rich protein 1 [Toxorhynchites rutilus septentrionalis]
MDGVSRILGGIVEVEDGNIRKLLGALDEHQTFWTEAHNEIEPHLTKISTMLGSALTHDRGLIALSHFIPQCPLDILLEKTQFHINVCAKICGQKGHIATIPLAYGVLEKILVKSLDSSDLNKLIISNLPKLMENITTTVDPFTHYAMLGFLEKAMRYYPGVSGATKNRIEEFLVSLVDSEDSQVVDRTGTCLLLLQQIRGGGQHGTLHKKTWEEYQLKLVDTIHDLLGKVFQHTPETFDVEENLECLKLPKLSTNYEPVNDARKIVTRLLNLVSYLEKAIVEPYPVAKPFRPMKILNLIFRGHSISCQTMSKNSIHENLAFGMFLPQIQADLLKVLDGLVLVLKLNLLPFGNLITDLFEQSLKATLTVDAKGRKKSYTSLRSRIYGCVALWCETTKFASGIEETVDNVLEHIVQDVTPYESEVTLTVNASGQKLSAKAKRKLRKQQNAATALSKAHSTDPFENTKQLRCDSGNETLCLAALRCLTKVLEAAGCFIKPVMHKLLQEKIVSLCFSVFSQLNAGTRQNLYHEPSCRKALLVALNALSVNPHHLCPPPLQYGASLFNVAEVRDPNADVRSVASALGRTTELLLHPRKEVFYFPLEENAVKDMLMAKKKHPLKSLFSADKQGHNAGGTLISFGESPSFDESQEEKRELGTTSETEPIARVEEITIDEEKSSEMVYDLEDEDNEGNFNKGELQKSTNDKTVESQVIHIDSDDTVDEVQVAGRTQAELSPIPANGGAIQVGKNESMERLAVSDDEVHVINEPLSDPALGKPGKLASPSSESWNQKNSNKRKSTTENSTKEADSSEKKSKVVLEDDDVDARVDDLVAEFVDELNDDV